MQSLVFPPITTGFNTFEEVVRGEAFYVDKTLFVKECFHSGAAAALILRPRRWGKSTNLGMLQYFLKAPLQEGSSPLGAIDPEKLQAKRLFFQDKKILQEAPELEKHLGAYTVLSLSLGGFEGESKEDLKEFLNEKIGTLFRSFKSLLPALDPGEKEKFQMFCEEKASLTRLSNSIAFLSELLMPLYQRPIFLLLDEYDAVVNHAWEGVLEKKSGFKDLLDSTVSFFGGFYENSVKMNQKIYRAVFTGVFPVLKGSLGSSMNNFTEDFLVSDRFPNSFGFTEAELKEIFQRRGIPLDQYPAKLEEAKHWYNGYQSPAGPLYNPWSIMSWVSTGKARGYWIAMGSLGILLKASQYFEELELLKELVQRKSVGVPVLQHLTLPHCTPESVTFQHAFWTLLVFSGYLCIEEELPDLEGAYSQCRVRIPNQELSQYFQNCLLEDFSSRYALSRSSTKDLSAALLRGAVDQFETLLRHFLMGTASFYDLSESKIEIFYQGFFLGLIIQYQQTHFIRSEFPSGLGRCDLLLIPKTPQYGQLAVLLEYKVDSSKKNKSLEDLAIEALQQVQEKDYLAEVAHFDHIAETLMVGLSFWKKDFVLKTQKIKNKSRA